jgi:nucleotide-binding universal stress UspA family protein
VSVSFSAVLVAGGVLGRPRTVIRRASEIAGSLGLELHLLRVLDRGSIPPDLEDRDLLTALRSADRILGEFEDLLEWTGTALGSELPPEQVHVRAGSLRTEVARLGTALGNPLVILEPAEELTGRALEDIVGVGAMPALLMRGELARTVVAATDLSDKRLPVLRAAAKLASTWGGRLVVVHNLPPVFLPMGVIAPSPSLVLPQAETVSAARARLERVARSLHPEARGIVCLHMDVSEAILEVAEKVGAGLIAVGSRRHSWLQRAIRVRGGVSARVVERFARSVLVTPMQHA